MSRERYDIRALVQASGISRRTIRYYVQLGLLPPPHGAGRGHWYDADHLARLGRIRDLQDRGRTLREIGEILEEGSAASARGEPEVSAPTLATHLSIAPGVELVVGHGATPPTPSQIRALGLAAARILSREEPS
jgi:DNA-binding transcriptional MerR regulator